MLKQSVKHLVPYRRDGVRIIRRIKEAVENMKRQGKTTYLEWVAPICDLRKNDLIRIAVMNPETLKVTETRKGRFILDTVEEQVLLGVDYIVNMGEDERSEKYVKVTPISYVDTLSSQPATVVCRIFTDSTFKEYYYDELDVKKIAKNLVFQKVYDEESQEYSTQFIDLRKEEEENVEVKSAERTEGERNAGITGN